MRVTGCSVKSRSPASGHNLEDEAPVRKPASPSAEIAGHVSPQMLKRYSHVRMEAKRRALSAIDTAAKHDAAPAKPPAASPQDETSTVQ